jgi:hypothetical protein
MKVEELAPLFPETRAGQRAMNLKSRPDRSAP